MSLEEFGWRVVAWLRQWVDYGAFPLRQRPLPVRRITNGNGTYPNQGTPLFEHPGLSSIGELQGEKLIAKADRAYRNRLNLLNLEDHDLGPVIDWNYDPSSRRKTPMGFSPRIDYRDYRVTGDAKFVWEPNRHQHLMLLGRAFCMTGERRYAEKVKEQIESWIQQCPYGKGMNWRSPLELAIRLINWVWSLELIAPSGLVDKAWSLHILPVIYRHLWEITRNYSRHSSANNHRIGEAAGVFMGSTAFPSLNGAAGWSADSKAILTEEIARQTYGDGGNREQALGYHIFALEFFLLAGLMARRMGSDFPPHYWERMEKMFDFLAAFVEGGDQAPMFGDCDDGYVVDLGQGQDPARSLLAVGAVLWNRSDWKALSNDHHESVSWLLGETGYKSYRSYRTYDSDEATISSRAFPESGYYLLQFGHREAADRISVVFDCGDLGFGPIAAHGHADALSFTLRAWGMDILVDPGTFDYFSYPQWREYFRSTRAHNTLVIDDQDQSPMQGSFLWGRPAKGRCIRWEPSSEGGSVTGEHDGYARLGKGVLHRRRISLDGPGMAVMVDDELEGRERHTAALHFHFAAECQVRNVDRNRFRVNCGYGVVTIQLDPCLEVQAYRGSEDPILGWVSRGYHRKEPCTTLVGRCGWSGPTTLRTQVLLERSWGNEGGGAGVTAEGRRFTPGVMEDIYPRESAYEEYRECDSSWNKLRV